MDRRDFIKSTIAGLTVTLSSGAVSASAPKVDQKKADQKKAEVFQLHGTDVYGKPLDLKDFAGRTVLVSFFTFDCSACSHDLQLMRDFYLRNVKKNFVLLGVNVDQNKKALDDYNEAATFAYPKDQRFPTVWRFAPGHTDSFGKLNATPSHFVLNSKHQLMFRRDGAFQPDDWDNLYLSLPS
ncbi:TlpA disulfide reductase family protein [Undibacterium cyanobacteriorum]|uniref:TlpA disulfide reductase family protein n=1 Tax=Undibacterium cyanobacteriorum TaxID=3073561 RepID=A0ABY9RJE5_9BURK|nr:TlpA disulfide reductase family protein [Undibacterium sp. 20NA77.5]WMW81352.1 TlpA disulfide reductase family protein [Undibacterium sp. 20NA77.5]